MQLSRVVADRVSVIIPTYNRSALIVRAVASALAGTEPGDEVLVIDDGSTDDTPSRLAAFGDRIRVIRTKNKGAGAARNRGIAEARCPLIAFLDSDDEWFPDKLYLQRSVMARRTDLVGCFSDFTLTDENGDDHPGWMKHWCDYGQPWDIVLGPAISFSAMAPLPNGRSDFSVYVGDLYPWLMEGIPVATTSVMIRTVVARSSARFAEDVPTFEDLWCIISMARAGPVALLGCETVRNYGHSGPRLTNSSSVLTCTTLRLRILDEFWGSDAAFLARHTERYERIRSSLNVELATLLMYQGRMEDARAALRSAPTASLFHRALSKLPAVAARRALTGRRWLRHRAAEFVRQLRSWQPRHEQAQ